MRYGFFRWAAVVLSLLAYQSPAFGGVDSAVSPPEQAKGQFLRNSNPIRGQYIVVLRPSAAAQDVQVVSKEVSARYRGRAGATFRHALRGFVVNMQEEDARALAADPQVAYVEEDGWARPVYFQSGAPWDLDRVDQRGLPLNGLYQYSNYTDFDREDNKFTLAGNLIYQFNEHWFGSLTAAWVSNNSDQPHASYESFSTSLGVTVQF